MIRRVLSTVAEVAGLVLIAWALSALAWWAAVAFVGAALVFVSWFLDGGKR